MKKRYVHMLMLLAVCMACLFLFTTEAKAAVEIASGTCGSKLTWVLDDSGTLTVSGQGSMYGYAENGEPWHDYCSQIKYLVIEEGVTSIGSYAFWCCEFQEIHIPSTLVVVGDHAFNVLPNVKIHIADLSSWCKIRYHGNWSRMTILGKGLFLSGNLLRQFVVPEDINEVLAYAFEFVDNMISVVITENVRRLEDSAFEAASALETIVFCGDAPVIDQSCFTGVVATAYYPADNPTWTDDKLQDYGGSLIWVPYTPQDSEFYFAVQPQKTNSYAGTYASLYATAIGEGVTYQWQICQSGSDAWSNIEQDQEGSQVNANSPQLVMKVFEDMDVKIRCVATDQNGNVIISETAELKAISTQCIDSTPILLENAIRYLDEVYIEKYPELGLRTLYGSQSDNIILQNLADLIAQGCETDKEKADAVYNWLVRNISRIEHAPLPIDAFLDRKGDCLGYAELMQDLLRKLGIPTALCTGWCGDMETLTTANIVNEAGHAWCMVYLDGEWALYDPAMYVGGTTDRDFIAKSYYFTDVDWIAPIYDVDYIPRLLKGDLIVAYYNGNYVFVSENGQIIRGVSWDNISWNHDGVGVQIWRYSEQQSKWTPIEGNRADYPREEGYIVQGGCWFYHEEKVFTYDETKLGKQYKWYLYIYENGIVAEYAVIEQNGRYYYGGGLGAHELVIKPEEARIRYSSMSIPVGYCGQVVWPTYLDAYSETHTITWSSDNPEVAVVDQNGNITALKEGTAYITIEVTRNEDGAISVHDGFWIYVDATQTEPDYSDANSNHQHTYIPYTTSVCGQFMTCSDKDCADSYWDPAGNGQDHSYDSGKVTLEPTCIHNGTKTYTCTACGSIKTETLEKQAEHTYDNNCDADCNSCGITRAISHTWDNDCDGECNICGETRTTPDHVWGEGYLVREPDCTTNGSMGYACSVCGISKTESTPKLNHTPGPEATASKDQICTVCNAVLVHAYGGTEPYVPVDTVWILAGTGIVAAGTTCVILVRRKKNKAA